MIQCVSDHTPYDDEPDPIEEGKNWLARNPETEDHGSERNYARAVIEALLNFIEEEGL